MKKIFSLLLVLTFIFASIPAVYAAVGDPVAQADVFQTNEDQSMTFNASNLLQNDTKYVSTQVSRIVSVSDTTALGELSWIGLLSESPIFSYAPDLNKNGVDSFTYTMEQGNFVNDVYVRSGNLSSTTVTITVSAINDMPVAVDDVPVLLAVNDAFTTDEDHPLTLSISRILSNDVDVDSTPIFIKSINLTTTHGALAVTTSGSAVTGLIYTPEANFNGTDAFEYVLGDGTLTDIGRVSILVNPINDTPAAIADNASTYINTAVTIAVLDNDKDVDGNQFVLYDFDTRGLTGSSVTLIGNKLVYSPPTGFIGTDKFSYVISEVRDAQHNEVSLLTSSAIVTVSVTLVPVVTPTPTPTPVVTTTTTTNNTAYNVAISKTGQGEVITGNFSISAGDLMIGKITPAVGWKLAGFTGANGSEVVLVGDVYKIFVGGVKEIIVNFVTTDTLIPEVTIPQATPNYVQFPELLDPMYMQGAVVTTSSSITTTKPGIVTTVVTTTTTTTVPAVDVVLDTDGVPQAGLPNTGGLPIEFPLAIGSLLSAIGFYVTKKNQK